MKEDKHVKFLWFQTGVKHCLNVSWRTEKSFWCNTSGGNAKDLLWQFCQPWKLLLIVFPPLQWVFIHRNSGQGCVCRNFLKRWCRFYHVCWLSVLLFFHCYHFENTSQAFWGLRDRDTGPLIFTFSSGRRHLWESRSARDAALAVFWLNLPLPWSSTWSAGQVRRPC